MEESTSPTSLALVYATCAASLGTLLYLFQRHIGGTPLVKYEPRVRVPWGPGIAMLAMLFPAMGILLFLLGTSHETPSDRSFVTDGLATSAMLAVIVSVVGLFLHAIVGADARDLGLPTSSRQLLSDMRIGLVGCIAVIIPIYVIQFSLTFLFEPETEHPLIHDLQQSHTTGMMFVGVLLVVIVAPLFEEFTFRLLLQGWLEKWEDQLLGYSGSARPRGVPQVEVEQDADESLSDEPDALLPPIAPAPLPPPLAGVLPGLPHGWLPILVSGSLFGLAHLGHGIAPVPLVLFGIVLGYMYQRTHRLAPSITAHALFNSYSMAMLWLSLE